MRVDVSTLGGASRGSVSSHHVPSMPAPLPPSQWQLAMGPPFISSPSLRRLRSFSAAWQGMAVDSGRGEGGVTRVVVVVS